MGKDLLVLGLFLGASYYFFNKKEDKATQETENEARLRGLNAGLNSSCNVCQKASGDNYLSVRGMCKLGDSCIATRQPKSVSLLQ